MISRFSVSNFKGFKNEFILNLSETNSYIFNSECIKNGIVNNALVYGHNGVGKSNLGMAIFDIVGHLTDNNISESEYNSKTYLNAASGLKTASFEYEFTFGTDKVVYRYEKTDLKTVIAESLRINQQEIASIDHRVSPVSKINVVGAETLKREITNPNLSLVKYILYNTVMDNTPENEVFMKFHHFVDRMLFFRSLNNNMYHGLERGTRDIQEDIIERGNVKDLEEFLNRVGIECILAENQELDRKLIDFYFGEKSLSLQEVASTGTLSLVLFYYWLQRIKETEKVSFLFIDEFDAYYHHDLSAMVVEELKKTGVQFILTSHNTSIITNDLLRPDCYFLMKKDSIKSLAKRTRKELREAHNIEKMYKAGSFNE